MNNCRKKNHLRCQAALRFTPETLQRFCIIACSLATRCRNFGLHFLSNFYPVSCICFRVPRTPPSCRSVPAAASLVLYRHGHKPSDAERRRHLKNEAVKLKAKSSISSMYNSRKQSFNAEYSCQKLRLGDLALNKEALHDCSEHCRFVNTRWYPPLTHSAGTKTVLLLLIPSAAFWNSHFSLSPSLSLSSRVCISFKNALKSLWNRRSLQILACRLYRINSGNHSSESWQCYVWRIWKALSSRPVSACRLPSLQFVWGVLYSRMS